MKSISRLTDEVRDLLLPGAINVDTHLPYQEGEAHERNLIYRRTGGLDEK